MYNMMNKILFKVKAWGQLYQKTGGKSILNYLKMLIKQDQKMLFNPT